MTDAPLTLDALGQAVDAGELDTVLVVFTDHYGRFLGKRYDAEFFLEEVVEHGSHACDYLLTVDMEMNPVPGFVFASSTASDGVRNVMLTNTGPKISTCAIVDDGVTSVNSVGG